jgi:hypothetical protein
MILDCLSSRARTSLAILFLLAVTAQLAAAVELFVSPSGDDADPGTKDRPFSTLRQAQRAARQAKESDAVTIWFRGGTYYLPEMLVLTAEDSGTARAPVIWQAWPGEEPVVSGGLKLDLKWKTYRDGIMKAKVPAGFVTDQLFVNGKLQPMARYPNFDPTVAIYNGYAADAISPERVARWADPGGGFIHMMHASMWGGYDYEITGKDAQGNLIYEGGWQNNRGGPPHKQYRMVENIFEELDAPGEWFLNRKSNTLYFFPPAGVDLSKATIEAVRLKHLVEFRGTEAAPVRFVTIKGLTFRHAARTFMETSEPVLLTDWAIYRGGAILFNGAEDCGLRDCLIEKVGGNAVFVNNYNRRVSITGCHITGAGASGVAFFGDPAAVRGARGWKERNAPVEGMDRAPGPKGDNYPADCLVEDCLIHGCGRVEKQTAGVAIDMARDITVRHCSIYDLPRAGINIGDGCWGGHVIEFCDVFDTVLETGDHGSFNSWGRDRHWSRRGWSLEALGMKDYRAIALLDVVEPVTLRNNRWRCDHGWDVDLDDGSSHYIICDNLLLNGGLKLREGFSRVAENNVIVNNSLHPHVWYAGSGDVVRHNILMAAYKPVRMTHWDGELDGNLFSSDAALAEVRAQCKTDAHSTAGDPRFLDPARGDYRVREDSPALTVGFTNFPMNEFGVVSPRLRALARTPELPVPGAGSAAPKRDAHTIVWLGATVRNVADEGERSAFGLPGVTGVLVLAAPAGSKAAEAGLRKDDVILGLGETAIAEVGDLASAEKALEGGAKVLTVRRSQEDWKLNLP